MFQDEHIFGSPLFRSHSCKLRCNAATLALWQEAIPCFHGGLDDLQCESLSLAVFDNNIHDCLNNHLALQGRWPDDAVIKEEEEGICMI